MATVNINKDQSGKIFSVDTTGGDVIVNLIDSALLTKNFRLGIVKNSIDSNKVIVKRSGSDTINGSASDIEQTIKDNIVIYILDRDNKKWIADLKIGADVLLAANNLSDLDNISIAKDNLGLGTAADKNTGTGANDVPTNNDLGALSILDAVGETEIEDNAVSLQKMALLSVGESELINSSVTLAKMADIPTETFIGRGSAGAGAPEILIPGEVRLLLNVEDGADVTDEANVTDALDGANIPNVTVAGGDKVLIQDISDSDKLVTTTAQDIADLGGGGGGGGKILQVKTQVISNTPFFSPGTNTWIATGFSISITPASTSNKILLSGVVHGEAGTSVNAAIRLKRGGTVIGVGDLVGGRTQATSAIMLAQREAPASGPFEFLDSPNTTSAIVYTIEINPIDDSDCSLNRGGTDTADPQAIRTISTFFVREVEA